MFQHSELINLILSSPSLFQKLNFVLNTKKILLCLLQLSRWLIIFLLFSAPPHWLFSRNLPHNRADAEWPPQDHRVSPAPVCGPHQGVPLPDPQGCQVPSQLPNHPSGHQTWQSFGKLKLCSQNLWFRPSQVSWKTQKLFWWIQILSVTILSWKSDNEIISAGKFCFKFQHQNSSVIIAKVIVSHSRNSRISPARLQQGPGWVFVKTLRPFDGNLQFNCHQGWCHGHTQLISHYC